MFWSDWDELEKRGIQYIVGQAEVCGDTGRRHLQLFIVFTNRITLAGLKRRIRDGPHYEPQRGSDKQAKEYCTKEDTRDDEDPWSVERGTPDAQGQRADLVEIKKRIDEGAAARVIAEEHFATWCQYRRSFEAYSQLVHNSEKRDWKTRVVVLWGPTGTGKSRRAHARMPQACVMQYANKFWSKYDGEDDVIWDDFRYGEIEKSLFLQLTDRYPAEVNIKGGWRNWKPRRIYITTNEDPHTWWEGDVDGNDMVIRRLDEIVHME